MVPDRQKVWTDGMDGRTDDAKTISLRLRRGIICVDLIGQYVLSASRVCKNVQGELDHRRVEPKFIKQYADASNPRCVVKLRI